MKKFATILGLTSIIGFSTASLPQETEQTVVDEKAYNGDILKAGEYSWMKSYVKGDFNHDNSYDWEMRIVTLDTNKDGKEDTLIANRYTQGKLTFEFEAADRDFNGIVDRVIKSSIENCKGCTSVIQGERGETIEDQKNYLIEKMNKENYEGKSMYFASNLPVHTTEGAVQAKYQGDTVWNVWKTKYFRLKWPKAVLGDHNGDGKFDWTATFDFVDRNKDGSTDLVEGNLHNEKGHALKGLLIDDNFDGLLDRVVADSETIDGKSGADGVYDSEWKAKDNKFEGQEAPLKMEDLAEKIDELVKEATKE